MRKWLVEIRKSKNLRQSDVARMVNVDTTTINKIELGIRRPSPETAKKIAKVLGFEWTKFFEKDVDEKFLRTKRDILKN